MNESEIHELTGVTTSVDRRGRVTIEWDLDARPSSCWVDAFAKYSAVANLERTVPSAYGRPLIVMGDASIVWSVLGEEVKAAARFVEEGVSTANLHLKMDRSPSAVR
jgi:hypothetical protein